MLCFLWSLQWGKKQNIIILGNWRCVKLVCYLLMLTYSEDYAALMIDDWMSIEHWWNASDGKMEGVWKNLSHFHSIHHKSHRDWPGIGPRPTQQEDNNYAPHTWQGLSRAAWHEIRVYLAPASSYLLIQVSLSRGFLHSQSPN